MYCGQCGKKIMENMLFCPFCGSPVVIPEQDGAKEEQPVLNNIPQAVQVAPAQQRPVSLFEHVESQQVADTQARMAVEAPQGGLEETEFEPQPEPEVKPQSETAEAELEQEVFVPLNFEEHAAPETADVSEEQMSHPGIKPEFIQAEEAPAENELRGEAPRRNTAPSRPIQRNAPRELKRTSGTRKQAFIPVKEVDLDNMFMDDLDDEDDYDGDDYDLEEEAPPRRRRYVQDDFSFEEPEHGSFVHRHIRGIVGLILLLILATVFGVWVFSENGQRVLATANLAWKPQAYANLGYEAYQKNNDLQAARYYEQALERDSSNYEYAHSAMVAYYEANEIESAAAMLKKCIEMDPESPEPYHEMLILYPDASTRPLEIQELIKLGYQRTGDESLNLS